MKELTAFLQQLAEKLGTTVEKLWTVLLKQAPISGTVNLALCLALVVAWVWAFRLVQKKTAIIPLSKQEGYSRGYGRADWEDEGKVLAWIGLGITFIVVGVIILSNAEHIVTAFFNPEYWALQKVLSACK